MDHMNSHFPLCELVKDRPVEQRVDDNDSDSDGDTAPVAGRKAARSLMLFRGDAHTNNLEALIDDHHKKDATGSANDSESTPQSFSTASQGNTSSAKDNSALCLRDSPNLEPISSATYIPHHPVKLREGSSIHSSLHSPDTNLQHLMADVEFDRDSDGDITRIKKRTPERLLRRRSTKVNFVGVPSDSERSKQSGLETGLEALDLEARKAHDQSSIGFNEDAEGDATTTASLHSTEAYPLTVEIRPFRNKVGGHTAIFRFSKRAVCKALMNRENVWYEAVEKRHPELLKFLPKYIGVLNVRYSSIVLEDPNSPQLHTVNEATDGGKLNTGDYRDDSTKLHLQRSDNRHLSQNGEKSIRRNRLSEDGPPPEVSLDDNLHIIPDLLRKHYSSSAPSISEDISCSIEGHLEVFPSTPPDKIGHEASIGSTSVNQDLQAQIIQEVFVPPGSKSDDIFEMDHDDIGFNTVPAQPNPLTHDNNFSNTDGDVDHGEHVKHIMRKHTRFERFILLEDLTADMQKPCALDLKMGTRQYGLEATDAKEASQRKKCASTTSRQLGVRVCGLQVWDKSKQRYFMRDKYFGRKLRSGEPFAKTLAKFLYDGLTAYSIICKIPHIIEQLEALIEIFGKLVGYRMYGLSVLLMYDGAADSDKTEVRTNIIDFAQSVLGDERAIHSYRKPPQHPHKPDMGYLRGLNLIKRYLKIVFKIITGEVYDTVSEHIDEFLIVNRERFTRPYDWVEEFVDPLESTDYGDPFNVSYNDDNDDAEVSD